MVAVQPHSPPKPQQIAVVPVLETAPLAPLPVAVTSASDKPPSSSSADRKPVEASHSIPNADGLPAEPAGGMHLHTVDIDAAIRTSQEELRKSGHEDGTGSEASSVVDNVQWV